MDLQSPLSETEDKLSIRDIQQNRQLWYKVCVLLYDLRQFVNRKSSRDRLELVLDPSYVGAPYFEPLEAERIKQAASKGTGLTLESLIQEELDKKLSRRKRVESADYRPCTAHDLAPVFEKFFDIRPKNLLRDKQFLKNVEEHGLSLVETQFVKKQSKDKRPKVKEAKNEGGVKLKTRIEKSSAHT